MADAIDLETLRTARDEAVAFRDAETDKQRRHLQAAAIAGNNVEQANTEIQGLELAIKRHSEGFSALVDSVSTQGLPPVVYSTTAAIRAVLRQAEGPMTNQEIRHAIMALGITDKQASSLGALLTQARDVERVGHGQWAMRKQ